MVDRYPQRLELTRQGAGGSYDKATEQYTPGAPTVVYRGPADAQELGDADLLRLADVAGVEVLSVAYRCFLGLPGKSPAIHPGDTGTLTFANGDTQSVRALKVSRIDNSVTLQLQ